MSDPPSFRVRGRTFALVPARDVETWSRERALQRLRELAREWPGRDALLRLSDSMMGPDDDVDRATAFLADRFESGRIVAVRLRNDTLGGASSTAFGAIDWDNIPMLSDRIADDWVGGVDAPIRPAPPGSIPEILFDYEVRWVDEIGQPLAGLALAMDVGPVRHTCTTDADGVARIRAPQADAARVEVTDLPALRDLFRPRWEQVRTGDWLPERIDHTFIECADPIAPVVVKPEIRETIVVQPWVVQARLLDLLFDTNKAFLLPGALAHVREIVRLYQRREGSSLLIVGHTDATGEPEDNDLVSRARADSVRAFLCDDVDAWLAWYGADRSPASRWGEGEDLLMLQAVLARSDEAPHDTPVRRFQTQHGLPVTGTIDTETRRELITQYMAADGTTLPAEIEPIVHGCGESFPLPKGELPGTSDTDARHRRVELFFFDGDLGVLPAPIGKISGPGAPEYPEWCRRAIESHDFFVRAGTVTVRVLLGALQAEGDHPADRPERLRLQSSDGLYELVLSYNDAIRVSPRHFALDFPQVPVAVPCTLHADFHGEGRFTHILFEDVDVGIETECGEGGLCRDEPPSAAPPAPSDAPAPDDDDVAEFPIL